MIITINGAFGSGKSTLAKEIARALNYELVDMGRYRRAKAKEKGMTMQEYDHYGETHHETDLEADAYLKQLGETNDNFVVTTRTGFFVIPHAVHLYLEVDSRIGAERVFQEIQKGSDRNEGAFQSMEQMEEHMQRRAQNEQERFSTIYPGHDLRDPNNYDLWLDTSHLSVQEVVEKVMSFLQNRGFK